MKNPSKYLALACGLALMAGAGVADAKIALNKISLNKIALNKIALNKIALNKIALNGLNDAATAEVGNPFEGLNTRAIAR